MIERSPLWPSVAAAELQPQRAERDVQLVVDDHQPVRRDLVERGQRGDRPAGEVHVGPRPGQRDRDPGQPSLGDVVARPVRLEARTGPAGQQRRHHAARRCACCPRTPAPGCRGRRRSSVLRSAGLLPFAAACLRRPRSRPAPRAPPRPPPLPRAPRPTCCAMTCRTSVSGSTCRVTPGGSVRSLACTAWPSSMPSMSTSMRLRDVRRVGFHRDLHQQLVEHPVARGDLAGHPDRHLDGDLLAPPDQDQVHVLEEALDRIPLHRLGQGDLAAVLESFQAQQHVRRLQREHQCRARAGSGGGSPCRARTARRAPGPRGGYGGLAPLPNSVRASAAILTSGTVLSPHLNVRCAFEV